MFAWIIHLLRRLFPEKTIRCWACGREFPAELIADVDLCGPCEVRETLTGWCDDCNRRCDRCTCPDPCDVCRRYLDDCICGNPYGFPEE